MGKFIHMLQHAYRFQKQKHCIGVIQMPKHWHIVQFKMVMETRHWWRLVGMIWDLWESCNVVKGQL